MLEKIGAVGYGILNVRDCVIVTDSDGSRRFTVPDHGPRIGELAARPGFRLGPCRFPDGAEVLCLDDRDDGASATPST